MNKNGKGLLSAPKGKKPLDLGTLIEENLKNSTISAYFDLPLKRQLRPETLILLETRVKRLIDKVENEPDSALGRAIGRYPDGQVFDDNPLFTAAILHNNYEEVAEQLASTLRNNSFGPYKTDAFLFYFIKETKGDNKVRLPEQTIPMVAEKFSREFEAFSESWKARLPDKEDRESWLMDAYGKNSDTGEGIQHYLERNEERIRGYLERKYKRRAAKA